MRVDARAELLIATAVGLITGLAINADLPASFLSESFQTDRSKTAVNLNPPASETIQRSSDSYYAKLNIPVPGR